MKIKCKVFTNKRNNQMNVTLPKKQIDNLLRAKKGKSPKWININLKNIEW